MYDKKHNYYMSAIPTIIFGVEVSSSTKRLDTKDITTGEIIQNYGVSNSLYCTICSYFKIVHQSEVVVDVATSIALKHPGPSSKKAQ
jgi:hypothetical protein